jgi:hypothetical protein
MRWELTAPWPGPRGILIPAGTIIDGTDPQWNGEPLPFPLPMEAKALDQAAADALARWHPHHLHLLHAAPGVVIRKLINV